MARVRFVDIEKYYAGATMPALRSVNEDIGDGEFFVLLGPSGCGKSTLLKLIAGLEEPSGGAIYLDDDLVNYVSPGQRNVAMVFQDYALYPHMSVARNIGFPLKMRGEDRTSRERAIAEAAASLDLGELLARPIERLSGGQRQRVAVARAIVRQPRVMLMDEPLSNLDALLRAQTREELLRLHRELGGTVIYVTHDQVEATTMGDRIAVMHDGILAQVGTPDEVYSHPRNQFVAGFIGTPPMNFFLGEVQTEGEVTHFRSELFDLALPERLRRALEAADTEGRDCVLGVRPEDIDVVPTDGGSTPWSVELVEAIGADRVLVVKGDGKRLRARPGRKRRFVMDQPVEVRFDMTEAHLFDPAGDNLTLGRERVGSVGRAGRDRSARGLASG